MGRALRRAALTLGLAIVVPVGTASAQPPSVQAFYMYGTTAGALEQNAYNDGCYFAQHQPGGDRVMMLDFGAARASSGGGGSLDFSDVYFSNPTILAALESASNGVHNCYRQGYTEIAYGNSNYHMTQAGMSTTDAYNAGIWQADRANDLYNYEQNNGRVQQDAAAGTDMEPDYDYRPISNNLVNGNAAAGVVLDYDYGSADGCPSSGSGGACDNGWGTFDVAWASFSGLALPAPEIYYGVNAAQWTVIRRSWDASKSGYYFAAATGESGAGLTPQQGWDYLSADNNGLVQSQPGIICFC